MSLQDTILIPGGPFWNGQAEEIILRTETDQGSHASVQKKNRGVNCWRGESTEVVR